MYINNLKVYAKNAVKIERFRALIEEFSDDIAMSFELKKCAVVHMKLGNLDNLPEVQEIPILQDEVSYTYLGIIKRLILHNDAKTVAEREFIKIIRNIWKIEINAKNIIDAIHTFVMPVLRYSFRIMKKTAAKLRVFDRKFRKVLTKGKFHHPKLNIHRLYISHQRGGRGLTGAIDCHW